MPRSAIALAGSLVFIAAYLFGVQALADFVVTWHWSLQAVFFLAAGLGWVWPVKWLMFWAARRPAK